MATRYHFSLANSDTGPIGFCATVIADSRRQALERLQEALRSAYPEGVTLFDDQRNGTSERPGPGIEYIEIYLNPDAVSLKSIDDEEEGADDS